LTNAVMSNEGTAKIQQRVQLANQQKNFQNALTMDAEDDYQSKQLSFTGIAEVQAGIRMQIASDLRMPLTKLFGVSSAGFNSGEDDIENYNSMDQHEIRDKAKFHLMRMVQLRSLQMFGTVLDDLRIKFPSLRQLSSEQEENVKTQKHNRALQALQAGGITREEFRAICDKENLLDYQLGEANE